VRPGLGVALRSHPIARRLSFVFDRDRLAAALGGVDESLWRPHEGPYHDGRWESVSLWAPGGDPLNQRSFGAALGPTPVMERCPYFQEVLEAFPCPRSRVRLMRLRPGGHIRRHYDPMDRISTDLLRLHVPIRTSPDVRFEVAGRRIEMRAGETWHVDVRFRHEVRNLASVDRVHLVADLLPGAARERILAGAVPVAHAWLTQYVILQWLPGRLRQRLKLAN